MNICRYALTWKKNFIVEIVNSEKCEKHFTVNTEIK